MNAEGPTESSPPVGNSLSHPPAGFGCHANKVDGYVLSCSVRDLKYRNYTALESTPWLIGLLAIFPPGSTCYTATTILKLKQDQVYLGKAAHVVVAGAASALNKLLASIIIQFKSIWC
jgi:hypothetical protein